MAPPRLVVANPPSERVVHQLEETKDEDGQEPPLRGKSFFPEATCVEQHSLVLGKWSDADGDGCTCRQMDNGLDQNT